MEKTYFLIKLHSRLLSEIDPSDFTLEAKAIGVKRVASRGRFSFIWNRPMTMAGVKRLMEIGWTVCDDEKTIIPNFFEVLSSCPIQFYAE